MRLLKSYCGDIVILETPETLILITYRLYELPANEGLTNSALIGVL